MWDQRLLGDDDLARYWEAVNVLREKDSSSQDIDKAEAFLVCLAKAAPGYPQPCITLVGYYFNKALSSPYGSAIRKAYQEKCFEYCRKYFHRSDPCANRERDVEASYRYQYGYVAYNTGHHDLGVANYRLAVKAGSLPAAYELGYILHGLRGWKRPRDISAAVDLYMKCITGSSTEAGIESFRYSARENLRSIIDNILAGYGVMRVVSTLQVETSPYRGSLRDNLSPEDFALLYRISRSAFNHLGAYAPMLHIINEVVLFLDQSDRTLLVKRVAADGLNILPVFNDYKIAAEFHEVILKADISKADWYFDFVDRVPDSDKAIVRSGLELWRSKVNLPSDFLTCTDDQLKIWLRGYLLSAKVCEGPREHLWLEAEKLIRFVYAKPEMKALAEEFAQLCGKPEALQPRVSSPSRLLPQSPGPVPVTPGLSAPANA